MSNRKGSLLALRDREPAQAAPQIEPPAAPAKKGRATTIPAAANATTGATTAPSRQGKKAMTGYFSPEMSFAMHMTSRKNGMSLQDAMAEAFNDWLRKMGESPVGK
ncbi:ribbon-helix-helix domain-containing protein [Sphingobium sp. CAP-1]|uniref:ribbon-helix-helix domain-containing protein n=1 Tax=Sphingobium sp. CAP-1 TaxID=2676077 RepID=UPI0012BB22EE|nr:ribbon-helix-helix domain-containing protein [Sphingobium sp. CAP-1]QGP81502.1 hypothetical protein GL174_20530 [Sphingobium sp. CAP-1]QGP81513.1 hypothetical protein GL174_20590 [Sphingobium sp. CAP-1]